MNRRLILSAAQEAGDPYAELYYEPDMENGGKGEVSFLDAFMRLSFEWDREKSNETLRDKGFSFYFARCVFRDEYLFFAEDKNNPNPSEDRFLAVGKPFDLQGVALLVVVNIKFEGNKYRIISAYPNESTRLEDKYESFKDMKQRVQQNVLLFPERDEYMRKWLRSRLREVGDSVTWMECGRKMTGVVLDVVKSGYYVESGGKLYLVNKYAAMRFV